MLLPPDAALSNQLHQGTHAKDVTGCPGISRWFLWAFGSRSRPSGWAAGVAKVDTIGIGIEYPPPGFSFIVPVEPHGCTLHATAFLWALCLPDYSYTSLFYGFKF